MKKNSSKHLVLVLSIIFSFLQLSGIMYFLKYDHYHMNLLLITFIPLLFINYNYFEKKYVTKDRIISSIGLLIVSTLTFISLFYRKLEYLNRNYVLCAFGIISLVFFSLRFLQSAMVNSTWALSKKQNSILRYSLLFTIPAIIYGIFLAACSPALISPDSLYIYNMAVTGGPYNNLHPLVYTLFIRLLVVIGLEMFGIMILQVILVAMSYAYIGYSFYKLGLKYIYCILLVIALTIYPINLFNAITFWKDIPYTIGLSLIAMELVNIAVNRDKQKGIQLSSLLILIFATIITIFSRHNGILSVCLVYISAVIYYIIKKYRRQALTFGILIVSSVALYCGVLYSSIALLGDKYVVPENNKVTETAAYALRIQGLTYLYKNSWGSLTDDEKQFIDKYIHLDKLDEHIEKYDVRSPYVSRTKAYCDTEALLTYDGLTNSEFNTGYINLLKKYPNGIINAYTCQTAIIWSTPNIGYTMYAAYPHDYYDTKDYPDMPFRIKSYFPKVKEFIQKIYDMTPTKSYYALFWRPAVFMLAILYLWYFGRRRKVFGTFLIAAPAIYNTLGYYVIIEAQDARYFYINMTIALIMLCYTMVEERKINE